MAEFPSASTSATNAANSAKSAAQSSATAAGNAIKAAESAHGAKASEGAAAASAAAAQSTATAIGAASVTPTANKIPIANGSGKLDPGWITAVRTVQPGTGITVDNTDPLNPIINSAGGDPHTITGDLHVTGEVHVDAFVETNGITSHGDATLEGLLDVGDQANFQNLVQIAGKLIANGIFQMHLASVASASNVTLPTANVVDITGNATIKKIATAGHQDGCAVWLRLPSGITITNMSGAGGPGLRIRLKGGADLTTTQPQVLPLMFNATSSEWVEAETQSSGGGSGVVTYATQAAAAADTTAVTPGALAWITDKARMYVAVAVADFQTAPTVGVFTNEMFNRNDQAAVWVREDKLHIPYQAHTNFYIDGLTVPETNNGLTLGAPTRGGRVFAKLFGDPADFARPLMNTFGIGDNPAVGGILGSSYDGFANAATIHATGSYNKFGFDLSPQHTLVRVASNLTVEPFQVVKFAFGGAVEPSVGAALADTDANANDMWGIALNGGASSPGNDQLVIVQTRGQVPCLLDTNSDPEGISAGTVMYLSATQPGRVTEVPPAGGTKVVYPVGRMSNQDYATDGQRILYIDLFNIQRKVPPALDDPRFATPTNATATPTASKIPIADGSGKLAAGWIPDGPNPVLHLSTQLAQTLDTGETIIGTWILPRRVMEAHSASSIWARLMLSWAAPDGTVVTYGWYVNGFDMGETAGGLTSSLQVRSNYSVGAISRLGSGDSTMYSAEACTIQMYIRVTNSGAGPATINYGSIVISGSSSDPQL